MISTIYYCRLNFCWFQKLNCVYQLNCNLNDTIIYLLMPILTIGTYNRLDRSEQTINTFSVLFQTFSSKIGKLHVFIQKFPEHFNVKRIPPLIDFILLFVLLRYYFIFFYQIFSQQKVLSVLKEKEEERKDSERRKEKNKQKKQDRNTVKNN